MRPVALDSTSHLFACRLLAVIAVLACVALARGTARAAETERQFDLPAGNASDTLKLAAQQAGLEIVFFAETVAGVRTSALRGKFRPHEGLERFVADTGLRLEADQQSEVLFVRRDIPPPGSAPPSTALSAQPMKSKNPFLVVSTWLALALAPNPGALAAERDAARRGPGLPPEETRREEAIRLTPFEVQADVDQSYGALNANSITGFRTELIKLPVSADIYNEAFMRDIGASSIEEMVQAFSAGAGFSFSDPSSPNNNPGDRVPDSYVSLRGLAAPAQRMDGFLPLTGYNTSATTSTAYSDNFNFERVEVINGPQALLYGFGGGGGVINMVSKQARFDKAAFGSLRYELNQWGGKKAVLDFGAGGRRLALRLALVDQDIVTRRVMIGGPMYGAHLQIAVKPFENTVVRLTGMHSYTNRNYGQNITYAAASAASDARNGQNLKYLLASNQLRASASGPSGGGDLGSSVINWGNVDSWVGGITNERTVDNIATLIAETKVNRWLSTQLSLGWKDWQEDAAAQTANLYPANHPSNPLGETAITTSIVADNYSPARTKTLRFAALAQNALFGGRAQSSSILGADYSRVKSAFISYRFYQADSNWRTIVDSAGNRIPQTRIIWPLGTTPQTYLPEEHDRRAVFFGVNYNREMANPVDPALISPENPVGVTPGGAGHYRVTDINKGIFGANTTEWLGGRLQTLAGFRLAKFYKLTQNQGTAPTALNPDIQATRLSKGTSADFTAGANYALRDWLRPYVAVSTSYNPPAIQLNGPYGDTVQPAKSRGAEVGFKFQSADNRISGSLAGYYVDATNEFNVIQTTLVTAINPPGINGRFGNPSTMINVDRKTKGLQLTLTANPHRDWRSRFSFGWTDGSIGTGKSYDLLYNDQFYTNSQGQVTYRNGEVVYVRPTFVAATPVATSTTAGAVPLTLAMMNTPGGVYYANPRDISGAILTTSNVGRVLTTVDPVRGPIRTGAVGLPISQIQINPGFVPPASVEVARAGDQTTGYPTYSLAFTNVYTVPTGWLKGLRVGGTARAAWDIRRYYYYVATVAPGAPRQLFAYPTMSQFDGLLGYSRRFGRYTWSTQLNVSNVFNHYDILITPNAATGFPGVKSAVFSQQPRSYLWSNSISF